jgi:hypothetical protein
MRWPSLCCPALLLCASCGTETWFVEVDVGYTQQQFSGTAGLAPTGGGLAPSQTTVDLENELGLDDAIGSPYGRVQAGLGSWGLTASGFVLSDNADGRVTRQFGNITVGTDVRTDVEMINVKGAVTYDVLDTTYLTISPGLAVNYLDFDVSVSAPSLGISERLQAEAPVPMLFGQVSSRVGIVSLTLEGGWITADVGDADGTFLDIEAILRLHLGLGTHLFTGYRYIDVDTNGIASGQRFDADFSVRGWVLGLGYRF